MKRQFAAALAAGFLALLCACGGGSAPVEEQPITPSDLEEEERVYATVYFPNETGDGLDSAEEEMSGGPGGLTDALAAHGALPEGTAVESFRITDIGDGGQTAALDLSPEFARGLQTCGSTEETLTMASLVNTFLECYDLVSLTVTVDGGPVETGHNVYDGPLLAYTFDNND